MSTQQFAVILTMIISSLFYLPLSIYYINKLYYQTYRNNNPADINSTNFLRQRYASLSLFCAIAFCIQFIDISIWVIPYAEWLSFKYINLLISLASTMHILAQFIITSTLALRFWLIWFRLKFEMMSQNDEWKKIINPHYRKDENLHNKNNFAMYNFVNRSSQNRLENTEWILKHKSTFGSHRWCLKRFLLLFIFISILILFTEFINHNLFQFLSKFEWLKLLLSSFVYLLLGIFWSLLLFLHCRSPKFSDSLFIKKELLYILQTMMLFLLMYIIFIAIFGLDLSESNVYSSGFFVEVIILFNAIAMSNMLMMYIIIYYPLKKVKHFTKDNFEREMSVSRTVTAEPSMPNANNLNNLNNLKRINSLSQDQNKPIKLDDVLRNEYGYNALIIHLSREFCMENLLSLTEFLQYKKYVFDRTCDHKMDRDLRYWFRMLPLDELPHSHIVYQYENQQLNRKKTWLSLKKQVSLSKSDTIQSRDNNDNDNDNISGLANTNTLSKSSSANTSYDVNDIEFIKQVKLSAHLLFQKYILIGSDFEVNIAYDLRMKQTNLLNDKDKWLENSEYDDLNKLRDIFDPVCSVMKRLISGAFMRFKHSDTFEKIEKEIRKR